MSEESQSTGSAKDPKKTVTVRHVMMRIVRILGFLISVIGTLRSASASKVERFDAFLWLFTALGWAFVLVVEVLLKERNEFI
jgi:hypothetical protein